MAKLRLRPTHVEATNIGDKSLVIYDHGLSGGRLVLKPGESYKFPTDVWNRRWRMRGLVRTANLPKPEPAGEPEPASDSKADEEVTTESAAKAPKTPKRRSSSK